MRQEEYISYVIKMVELIEEYCITYNDWPKQKDEERKTKDGTTSAKLSRWLYTSLYMTGNFKYLDVLDHNGVSLKERLDILHSKYGRQSKRSDQYKIMLVNLIEEYCITYKEWPKNCNSKIKTEKDKISCRLASWLIDTNYYTSNFKYANIVDEKGVTLKERLDQLCKKYNYVNLKSDATKIEKVNLIEEYCNTYKEWPKFSQFENKTKGIISHQLAAWLSRNGYLTSEFKYANVLDTNGISLQERLDRLYKQYGYVGRQSAMSKIKMVESIEEYCNVYHEWPKDSNKKRVLKSGITNKQLAFWLRQSNYYTSEFKYMDVVDETGLKIKDRLDSLYQQYFHISNKSDKHKIQMVELIEEYCITYGKWPSHSNLTVNNGYSSLQLVKWLTVSGYMTKNFKYADIVTENGIRLEDKLDSLFAKYGPKKDKKSSSYTQMTDLIEKYCILNQKWPRRYDRNNNADKINVLQLVKWLSVSGYYTKNFKYKEILDDNGVNIKKRLDGLFAIFANEYEIKMLEDRVLMDLNLFKAKNSETLGESLYYLAVQLKLSKENQDTENFIYYKTVFEAKLKNNFIKLDVEEFINSFSLPLSDRLDYCYTKWQYYYNENNYDLAILFKRLYNYENALAVQPEEKQKVKK